MNCFALKITLVVHVEQEAYIYMGPQAAKHLVWRVFLQQLRSLVTASNSGQDRCQATPVGIRDTCIDILPLVE